MIVDIETTKHYCVYTFKKKNFNYSIACKKFSVFKFLILYVQALFKS